MIPDPIDDAVLERYVLGRVDEAARDDIETWLLATPDAPALVDAIELELAERYLDGDLPEPDRADFARALRQRPALAGRLTLVEGLRARARADATPAPLPFVPPVRARARWFQASWVPVSLAASLLVAASLAAWLQIERTRLASELRDLQARRATPATPSTAPGIPPAALAPRTSAAAAVVAATLSAGVTRSSALPLIMTTPDTQLVRLDLRVPAGTAPVRAELVDADLAERLRLGPLVASPDGPATHVVLDVPASAIPPGSYLITLRPANGRPSPTFTYTFRVVARPE
jgi:hypothetical protein